MFTRIRPGRLAYAAPVGGTGEFTTYPIQFDGTDLLVNAQVETSGRIRLELQSEDGTPIDGYTLEDSDPFVGDKIDHKPSWNGRRLSDFFRSDPEVQTRTGKRETVYASDPVVQ